MDLKSKLKSLVSPNQDRRRSDGHLMVRNDQVIDAPSLGGRNASGPNLLNEDIVAHISRYMSEQESRNLIKVVSVCNSDQEKEDEEILKQMDPIYYENVDTFNVEYEMDRCPVLLTDDHLVQEIKRLKRQLSVVSRRVNQMMIQDQPVYKQEFARIITMKETVDATTILVNEAKLKVYQAKNLLTIRALSLMANHQRRDNMVRLLNQLRCLQQQPLPPFQPSHGASGSPRSPRTPGSSPSHSANSSSNKISP